MLEFKKITDFPRGTIYNILQDAYSYKFCECRYDRISVMIADSLFVEGLIENEYLMLYESGALSVEQLEEIRLRGLNGRR